MILSDLNEIKTDLWKLNVMVIKKKQKNNNNLKS